MMRRGLVYAALFVGAVIFAWPFFWMASTSAKLDRELFDGNNRFLPERPIPRLQSPYLDDRLFAAVDGARMGEVLPMIFVDGGGVEQDVENWWQAIGTILLGNVIVLVPMALRSHDNSSSESALIVRADTASSAMTGRVTTAWQSAMKTLLLCIS